MANPAGEAPLEVGNLKLVLDDLSDFLNLEGVNTTESSMEVAGIERGPLPSVGSATSSVSSSSLTTLKNQGYLAVPIKGSGVNPLKSTSYYLVDLANASIETWMWRYAWRMKHG